MKESLSIDETLDDSRELGNWVADRLDGLRIPSLPDCKRMQLSMASLHLAIEHAQSIVILVDDEKFGTALAILRPMFEAVVRGVWLRYSASGNQVYDATRGNFPIFRVMTSSSPAWEDSGETVPLDVVRKKVWVQLCGYTHGDCGQLGARLGSTGLRAQYPTDEIMAALRWSDAIQLYCGVELADAAGAPTLAQTFLREVTAGKLKVDS